MGTVTSALKVAIEKSAPAIPVEVNASRQITVNRLTKQYIIGTNQKAIRLATKMTHDLV